MSRLLSGVSSDERTRLGVVQEVLQGKDGKPHVLLTCIPSDPKDPNSPGLYLLWRDQFTRKWRWALRDWPDDDLGLSNHGAKAQLEEAVERCKSHHAQRSQLGRTAT